jgi:hypothetical protein
MLPYLTSCGDYACPTPCSCGCTAPAGPDIQASTSKKDKKSSAWWIIVLLLVLVVIFALLFKSWKGKQENNAVLASLKRHASVKAGRTGASLHQNAVYAPNPIVIGGGVGAAPGLENPAYDASHGMGMTNAMYDVANPAKFIIPLYDEVCHSFHVFGFGIAS